MGNRFGKKSLIDQGCNAITNYKLARHNLSFIGGEVGTEWRCCDSQHKAMLKIFKQFSKTVIMKPHQRLPNQYRLVNLSSCMQLFNVFHHGHKTLKSF
jgi:hypothetical protein